MTDAERDKKIQEILGHKPPYPDAVQRINAVHKEFEADKLSLKVAGAGREGTPSPGKSPIKQPGSAPLTGRK